MYPFRHIRLAYQESELTFEGYRYRRQSEALYHIVQPSDLLAREGWIVEKGLHLHERAQIDHQPSRHRPGVRRLFLEKTSTRPARRLEAVVSLRTRGESNYYHAINDILGGRVRLIDEVGLSSDLPVVVSRALFSQPFFSAVRHSPALVDREIVVQDRGRLRCGEIYFGQSATWNIANILYALDALQVPASDANTTGRLFVSRRPPALRSIGNSRQVEDAVQRHGFRVVDTSQLSLDEQMEIFSSASIVVGVHGAGLLNIIYRRQAPLHLVEIFPLESAMSPPPHYMAIADGLGFRYTPMLSSMSCSRVGQEGLLIDVDHLERVLMRVLDESS